MEPLQTISVEVIADPILWALAGMIFLLVFALVYVLAYNQGYKKAMRCFYLYPDVFKRKLNHYEHDFWRGRE